MYTSLVYAQLPDDTQNYFAYIQYVVIKSRQERFLTEITVRDEWFDMS